MTTIPRVIKWGFDPGASDITVLRTQRGRDVWGAIRVNHMVDQNFNGQVQAFLDDLDANGLPEDAEQLYKRASLYSLHFFGSNGLVADMEWWRDMLELLRGEVQLTHQVPSKPTAETGHTAQEGAQPYKVR